MHERRSGSAAALAAGAGTCPCAALSGHVCGVMPVRSCVWYHACQVGFQGFRCVQVSDILAAIKEARRPSMDDPRSSSGAALAAAGGASPGASLSSDSGDMPAAARALSTDLATLESRLSGEASLHALASPRRLSADLPMRGSGSSDVVLREGRRGSLRIFGTEVDQVDDGSTAERAGADVDAAAPTAGPEEARRNRPS